MASSSLFPDQVIGLNKTEWEFVVRRSQDTKVLNLETYDDEIAKEEHSRSRVIVRNCSDIFVPGDGVQKLGLNNLNSYFGVRPFIIIKNYKKNNISLYYRKRSQGCSKKGATDIQEVLH